MPHRRWQRPPRRRGRRSLPPYRGARRKEGEAPAPDSLPGPPPIEVAAQQDGGGDLVHCASATATPSSRFDHQRLRHTCGVALVESSHFTTCRLGDIVRQGTRHFGRCAFVATLRDGKSHDDFSHFQFLAQPGYLLYSFLRIDHI